QQGPTPPPGVGGRPEEGSGGSARAPPRPGGGSHGGGPGAGAEPAPARAGGAVSLGFARRAPLRESLPFHGVLGDGVEGAHAVLPADLLPLLVGAPVIADGHLEDAGTGARHLGGDLRLEAEAILLDLQRLDELAAEGLVAGL